MAIPYNPQVVPGYFAVPGVTVFAGSIGIGAAGAIDAKTVNVFTTDPAMSQVVVTKTATKTGRYTLTLPRNYLHLLFKGVSVTSVDDAALPTTTGLGACFRDHDIGGGANDGTIEVQLFRTDTNADAEGASGTEVSFILVVCDKNRP